MTAAVLLQQPKARYLFYPATENDHSQVFCNKAVPVPKQYLKLISAPVAKHEKSRGKRIKLHFHLNKYQQSVCQA